ncbi:MAG: hypothetical protein VYE73_11005 [Acidobacteriota bacterium]|nr:hypothetical protein [Acidobacteriota bacterium]
MVRSLELDNERKELFIRKHAPTLIRSLFRSFAGLRGISPFYGAFAERVLRCRVGQFQGEGLGPIRSRSFSR